MSDLISCFYVFPTERCQRRHYVLRLSHSFFRSFICPSGQILLPRYLMKGLNNFDRSHKEYSLAPTDDLIRCPVLAPAQYCALILCLFWRYINILFAYILPYILTFFFFPYTFFLRYLLPYSFTSLLIHLLPELARSISRLEVVGGYQTDLYFFVLILYCIVGLYFVMIFLCLI